MKSLNNQYGSLLTFCNGVDRDASVIYGSTAEAKDRVRSKKDGKLKIGANGWLAINSQNELPISGDIRNLWLGVSSLQSLFIAEHNAVCDVIKVRQPQTLLTICIYTLGVLSA
jgi:hypothetical protein